MAEPAETPPSALLDRPPSQRLLEYRYRFGQSTVFGVPVVALEAFGRALGGAEADRWVALFQALLSGWVVYVAATGMLAEGMLNLLARRRTRREAVIDASVALLALLLYLVSVPRVVALLVGYPAREWPGSFAECVVVLAAWTGLRWAQKRNSAG